MNLFHVTFSKSVRLEEFELAQLQMHTQVTLHLWTYIHCNAFHWPYFISLQVQLFLRETWVTNLCYGIHSSLRDAGPGWYSLSESCWQVYCMSKMYCLMTQIRYTLQDSLRFLVQDSLTSLAQLVLDACHSVLYCPPDLTWGADLIHSPYKWDSVFLAHRLLLLTDVRPEKKKLMVRCCISKALCKW